MGFYPCFAITDKGARMNKLHFTGIEMNSRTPRNHAPENDLRWAVRIESSGVEFIPVTDKETAEHRSQVINDKYHAGCLNGERMKPVRAQAVLSPFDEAEHWRLCAKAQSEWIKDLKCELFDLVATSMPRAYLIPSTEAMKEAWFGTDGEEGSDLPPAIRDYTMRLISKLPSLRKKKAPVNSIESDVNEVIDPGF